MSSIDTFVKFVQPLNAYSPKDLTFNNLTFCNLVIFSNALLLIFSSLVIVTSISVVGIVPKI